MTWFYIFGKTPDNFLQYSMHISPSILSKHTDLLGFSALNFDFIPSTFKSE